MCYWRLFERERLLERERLFERERERLLLFERERLLLFERERERDIEPSELKLLRTLLLLPVASSELKPWVLALDKTRSSSLLLDILY